MKLMPVESDGSIELVREKDVHLDNERGLLDLWKAIRRPKPKNKMYQPLRILDETEHKKFKTHWTGFKKELYSLEPVPKMWDIAPDVVEEFYDRQRQYAENRPVNHHTKRQANGRAARRTKLPPGSRQQRANRPSPRE